MFFLQASGRIVAAGSGRVSGEINDNFALARYRKDASLDTPLSNDGKLTTDFGGFDYGRAVAIQTDGKIVVADYSWGGSDDNDIAPARYEP